MSRCGAFMILFVLTVPALAGGPEPAGTEAEKKEVPVLTFADLLKKGMVECLGKEICIRAKVCWDYADVKIPEDPTPPEQLSKKAGRLKVPFEGEEFKDIKGKKYLWAEGKGFSRVADENGREQYSFNDLRLANGSEEYRLKVKLKLRPMFDETHLKNPAFVKQSNDPRYWTQTFELEILGVEKAGEEKPESSRQGASGK